MAEAHDQGHVVFDDQQGYAPGQEFLHQGHEVFGFPGIEAGGGLVHEQELRLLGQGPGDFQTPLVAVGQGLSGLVLLAPQAHQFQQFQGQPAIFRLGSAHHWQRQEGSKDSHLLVEVNPGENVFQHGHAPEELDILEGAGEPQAGPAVGGQTQHIRASQPDFAGARGQQAVNQVEAGGLAGAVGADQPEDLARRHRKGDVSQGLNAAERFTQAVDFKHGKNLGGKGEKGKREKLKNWCNRIFIFRPLSQLAPFPSTTWERVRRGRRRNVPPPFSLFAFSPFAPCFIPKLPGTPCPNRPAALPGRRANPRRCRPG